MGNIYLTRHSSASVRGTASIRSLLEVKQTCRDRGFFDYKRRGKWDLSFWDESFDGSWALVGYHGDGSLKPSRFEDYETFKRRLAER
jgi:hypothetical protein